MDFTINFVTHNNVALLESTLRTNLAALTDRTTHSFETILTVDGAERAPCDAYMDLAKRFNVDEVRFRWRAKNCAGGDPSNNAHFHEFSDKTPYLISLEDDVAVFRLDPHFDVLGSIAAFFQRHPQVGLITKMDDTDQWVWKLQSVAADFEPGIASVNRVSSHFLAYHTAVARSQLGRPELSRFFDDGAEWHNFEDCLSEKFRQPSGGGIAFPDGWPIRVYHCDRKIAPDSVFYSKSPQVKHAEFERRRAEIEKALQGTARPDSQNPATH